MVGLAVNAQVHDVVTADGAVVDDDVPRPESDSVPLELYVSYDLAKVAPRVIRVYHTFFTSNFFFPSATSPLAPALALLTLGAAPASVISTSAMLLFGRLVCGVFAVVVSCERAWRGWAVGQQFLYGYWCSGCKGVTSRRLCNKLHFIDVDGSSVK